MLCWIYRVLRVAGLTFPPCAGRAQPLLRDVGTVFRGEAKSRGLDLRIRLCRGRGCCIGGCLDVAAVVGQPDSQRLTVYLAGGVLMCARKRGTDWQVEVWDTGVGVAKRR